MGELEPRSGVGEVALREKPIPVLEGLRLVDDACGTQVLEAISKLWIGTT